MILIVEGIDGAGKSKLAEQLSKQTGYKVLHRSKPETEEDKELMMGQYVQLIRSGRNMILDRAWYSELIYGPIMRDESVISYQQMYSLEKLLAKTGSMVIHCTGPEPLLWKRCQERGDDYIVDRTTFTKLYDNYNELFDIPHYIPVVRYEYQDL